MSKVLFCVRLFFLNAAFLMSINSACASKEPQVVRTGTKIGISVIGNPDVFGSNVYMRYELLSGDRIVYSQIAVANTCTLFAIGSMAGQRTYLLQYAPGGNECDMETRIVRVSNEDKVSVSPVAGPCVEPSVELKKDGSIWLSFRPDAFRDPSIAIIAGGSFVISGHIVKPDAEVTLSESAIYPSLKSATGKSGYDAIAEDKALEMSLRKLLNERLIDLTDRLKTFSPENCYYKKGTYFAEGCMPHNCGDAAAISIDVYTGSIFAAYLKSGQIMIFGAEGIDSLPAQLQRWLIELNGQGKRIFVNQ